MQQSSRLQFTGYLPRYRDVYHRLRDAVLQGVYPYGARVPSIRTLASELGLSRATIEKAYDLLIGEGLLVSHGQAGTTVSYVPPRKRTVQVPSNLDQSIANSTRPEDGLSDVAEDNQFGTMAERTGVSPFQISIPAIDVFPRAAWLKISQRILRDRAEISHLVDDVQGYYGLRKAICGYLSVARGIRCGPHQVFITGGYRQSLSLLLGALIPSESLVWVEDPGYLPTSAVLKQFGMRPVPVPVDSEGIDVNDGRQSAFHARMAITTPTTQSPLGVCMSLRRRTALVDWAAETGGWIVEDDYDNEFCSEGKHLPTLHDLDIYGRTFYLGTFSNTLHPNLRVSYVVCSDAAAAPFRKAAETMLDGISILQQKVLAAFIAEGHFALHLKRSRSICAARRKVVIDALTSQLGSQLSICPKNCGLHLFATTTGSINDVAFCEFAGEKGLVLSSLSSKYITAKPKHGLLLGYANFSNETQLLRSVNLLKDCLNHFNHAKQ